MKSIFGLLLFFAFTMGVQAFAASSYVCKDLGSYTCAVSRSTGQCTHSWSNDEDGNAMFYCLKFTGQAKSNYKPSNYQCKQTSTGVCAQSLRTGQCTHEWSSREHSDPMYSCRKHLGLEKSNFTKANYVCKRTTNGACAQSVRTGQCTHEWSDREDGDAMYQCRQFLN